MSGCNEQISDGTNGNLIKLTTALTSSIVFLILLIINKVLQKKIFFRLQLTEEWWQDKIQIISTLLE